MTVNPSFSIVVPVYNAEKQLQDCIDSIINQSFTDFELLLVDDGSSDESGKICDEYAAKDRRIIVIHKENGGVSSARNTGIAQAKGEWITFADSDDYLEKDFLNRMLHKALASGAGAVFCNCYLVSANAKEADMRFGKETVESSDDILRRLLLKRGMRTELWGKIFKRQWLTDLRLRENVAIGEDLLFLMEIYCAIDGTTAIITAPLYDYRQLETSAMNRQNRLKHNRILLSEYLNFIGEHQEIRQRFPTENAVFIIRVVLSIIKQDILRQGRMADLRSLLKENFSLAQQKLMRSEKRLVRLLFIHPLLAKIERFFVKRIYKDEI